MPTRGNLDNGVEGFSAGVRAGPPLHRSLPGASRAPMLSFCFRRFAIGPGRGQAKLSGRHVNNARRSPEPFASRIFWFSTKTGLHFLRRWKLWPTLEWCFSGDKHFAEVVSETAGERIGVANGRNARLSRQRVCAFRPDHRSQLLSVLIHGFRFNRQPTKTHGEPRNADGKHKGTSKRRDRRYPGHRSIGRNDVRNRRMNVKIGILPFLVSVR